MSSCQQELHADIQSHFLPEMLGCMLRTLRTHMASVDLAELTQGLRACFKVLSKIQMPVAFMDIEAGAHTQEAEVQEAEEADKQIEVRPCLCL